MEAKSRKRGRCRSKSVVRSRKRKMSRSPVAPDGAASRFQNHPPMTTFEGYLRTENFLAGDEHGTLIRSLRSPLPTSFRVRSDQAHEELKDFIRQRSVEAYSIPGIKGAWQVYRESPAMKEWLTSKTISGEVSRQEFVSMIPVLLLQVTSHHRVLDLCASPGSKTTQAVDDMYAGGASPSGFCIANELNPKRAWILSHRCKALGERQRSLAVVVHNAARFPNAEAELHDRSKCSPRPYDRIICDVPCSGDGTLRKDLKAWKVWHPSFGISLHPLQVRIAKRGIALLKVGGIMTYSTCSFHPIENEAVVTALLKTGCVDILPTKLDGIAFRPGLSHWRVLDDELEEVCRGEDVVGYPDSLWPPSDREIAERLAHCVRMVPHDNDTGGFFIAVLKKLRDFDAPEKPIKIRKPIVTPTASHHKLYQRSSECQISEEDCVTVRRSPNGKRLFRLSPPLADHLMQRPGSDKLNIAYAGQGKTVDSQ
eukprot:scaffold6420_cov168-Amphora_coffeaeformis.AAC.38